MKTHDRRGPTARSILTLAAIALLALVNAVCQTSPAKTAKQPEARSAPAVSTSGNGAQQQPHAAQRLIIYYFHGNLRCPTCIKLESLAKSEVETDFTDAIKSGRLEWKTVNVEEKGNEHFENDYKLYTKSVIVSTLEDGKETSWKNLDRIWQLIHDESQYRAYIRTEVKACLDGKCL
jgi:hypothetical protein